MAQIGKSKVTKVRPTGQESPQARARRLGGTRFRRRGTAARTLTPPPPQYSESSFNPDLIITPVQGVFDNGGKEIITSIATARLLHLWQRRKGKHQHPMKYAEAVDWAKEAVVAERGLNPDRLLVAKSSLGKPEKGETVKLQSQKWKFTVVIEVCENVPYPTITQSKRRR